MSYAKLIRTELWKTTAEAKLYTFDFSDDMDTGETISGTPTVTVSPTSGAPTIGIPAVSGQNVQVMISAGSAGTYYVTCRIVTSTAETLDGIGVLVVAAM